ncbi:hypothetical protein GI582_23670 [Sulfitobacter sp. BDSS02]|nr:hypothetical protein [Sulfitobacter sp. BDSS02]
MNCILRACVIGLLIAILTQSLTAQEASERKNQYAAKVVCGTQPDPKNLQFVQGVYASVVNILNTEDVRQSLDISVALTHPPVPPAPGENVEITTLELEPGEAVALDCMDIEALGFPFGLPDDYIDGFAVIASTGHLGVQAVYTAAPLMKDGCCKTWLGPVASIDVEQIPPAMAPSGPGHTPDLLPESPELEADPLGAPGTGYCGPVSPDGGPPSAVAEIVNKGASAAGASVAQFDFGTFGQTQVPIPTLEPGERQPISVEIPAQCFGSGRGDGRNNTCPFDVIADVNSELVESLETNNTRRGHCLRAQPG